MTICSIALFGALLLGFLTLVVLVSLGPGQALKMLLAGGLGLIFFLWYEWKELKPQSQPQRHQDGDFPTGVGGEPRIDADSAQFDKRALR